MELSTIRMEQVAKLLAEEIVEKMVGRQDVNENRRNDERVGQRSGEYGNAASD